MTLRLLLVVLCAVAGPLASQDVVGRWSLQIRGPATIDRGDLRIDRDGGRLLLDSQDTLWLELERFTISDNMISFEIAGGRRFSGTFTQTEMSGTVLEPGASAFRWLALPIQPGAQRWPVRPRVTVSQLLVGDPASTARYPASWREALPAPSTLIIEHARLAAAAGLAPVDSMKIVERAGSFVLGFDPEGRRLVASIVRGIAESEAADREFRSLFVGNGGRLRLDIHDFAWQWAEDQHGLRSLNPESLGEILAVLGMAVRNDDPVELKVTVWRFWQHSAARRSSVDRLVTSSDLRLATAATALRSLLQGYDAAEGWWLRATAWLMKSRWIDIDGSWSSPADLVARFWERESLPVPPLEISHYGAAQAVPVIGVSRLGELLMRSANGVGDEFLNRAGGFAAALEGWRSLEFAETTPLLLDLGDESTVLRSPASVARSRLGGFLAAEDGIRIESAIMPLLAVGTVVHEWQHLLLEEARLSRSDRPGLRVESWGLRLLEGDPWLAEGAAEWATERVFSLAEGAMPIFAVAEAEKRLAIGSQNSDDTHVLGYLLVRAARARLESDEAMRQLLIASLHDPRAVAAVAGFDGAVGETMARPATLMMIPEVTFVIDGGIADGAVRRLIIPESVGEN